jgi:predicted TIM-barrel fold metal-dependent hydrolase
MSMPAAPQDTSPEPVRHSSGTARPKLKVPVNACDCHMHIYDSRFPAAPNAVITHPDASVGDYRGLQRRIGTSRCVVVNPSAYGIDNACTLEAMAKLGASARGVAVVDADVTDAELERLDRLGVRGIRFNLVQVGATTIDMLEPLAARVAELGWHVQINSRGDEIAGCEDLLGRLPCAVVIDHLGRIDQPAGTDHPGFRAVMRLLDRGHIWVKLSGAYIVSRTGAPSYADVGRIARAYVRAAPQRLVWASDWPHATQNPKPDDAVLTDLLAQWAPDEATRRRILVENPAALYGFP